MWMGIREMEYGTEVELFKKDDMDRKNGRRGEGRDERVCEERTDGAVRASE